MEILTIKQMQQQLLLAYQTTKNKQKMQLHFGFDTNGKPSIYVWFHGGSEQKPCVNIAVYESLDDYDKMVLFNRAMACIDGSEDPFRERGKSK